MLISERLLIDVTFVYCGQTVGWIKMKLGMQVGLGPGHIVLDGDPASPPQRGTAPNYHHMSVVAKRLVESRCHLVRGRPRPTRHFVTWGPISPAQGGGAVALHFSVHVLLWTNGWMDQDATWYGG